MTDLSPAAQAVLDAFKQQVELTWLTKDPEQVGLAAALRAAADQVAPGPWAVNSCCDERQRSIWCGLLAIAAELDGTQPPSENDFDG